MTMKSSLNIAALLSLCLAASPVQAQLARTFVSAANGNDGNSCDRPTPCRTFQAAHDKTFSEGEVTVLDTGGYGALTITKSISIVSEVGEASVLVSGGGTGITINAPNAYVNLRGLTIQGIGFGGGVGLRMDNAFALTITNCVIRNLTSAGLILQANGTTHVAISNTLIADNGQWGIQANVFLASPGPMRLDLNRIEVRNSRDGLLLQGVSGGLHTSISDSVFSGNAFTGISVAGVAGRPSTAVVTRSVISNNHTDGLLASGDRGFIAIGGSLISGNAVTWRVTSSGTVSSFGDNHVFGNFDNDPTLPVISRK